MTKKILKNNDKLLNDMMKDLTNQNKLYKPGNYWTFYEKNTVYSDLNQDDEKLLLSKEIVVLKNNDQMHNERGLCRDELVLNIYGAESNI